MRVHAIVGELETARAAVAAGATVVQLRLKDATTAEVVAAGGPLLDLCRDSGVPLVVNDDVEAAIELNADGETPLLELGQQAELSELREPHRRLPGAPDRSQP